MSTSTSLHALVSGGSIAGLSAAYWLAKTGWDVTLIERADSFREGGQNVDIRGVGHEVLDRMGLVDTIRALNTGETGTVIVDENDTVVATMPDVGADSATAELEVLRGDLAHAIRDKLPAHVNLCYGETITAIEDDDNGVDVTTTRQVKRTFDLLVIAEGVRSTTRDLVFDDVVLRPLDIDMVFGTIDRLDSDDSKWRWMTTTKGRQAHLRPDSHGTTRAILASSPSQDLSRRDSTTVQRELEQRFADVGWAVPRILHGFASSNDVYADSLTQVYAPTWHRGRVCLIGDAAWCVTPLGGGGATLALTSGYVLAAYLAQDLAPKRADEEAEVAAEAEKNAEKTNIAAALHRCDQWLRPLVDEVQKMPPGMVKMAYPQTTVGLRITRLLNRALTSKLARPLAAKMTQVADSDQPLPDCP